MQKYVEKYLHMKKNPDCKELTLYSIITPFEAFEMSCIWKSYVK